MPLKNFKTRNGIDVDTYTIPNAVVQATIKTNSATTLDTVPMASFNSVEYLVTITQGSKIRTSKVVMHTDGTSVDMTEYGITETGGTISGVVISATTASTNAVLQGTITDAATTIARVKMSRNINVLFTPVAPDAPTIGAVTGGVEQASVEFTAPYDNGGASITSYRATSTPGSITGTASSSPITVVGLIGGTSYTFTVTATNSAGTSAASSASNSITPTASQQGGYISGGLNVSTTYNTIDKLLFAGDTVSTLAATLTANTTGVSGMANSGTAGYLAGGNTNNNASTNLTRIDKITFSDDSKSTISATLGTARSNALGMANSGTAGYTAGGWDTSFNILTSIEKLLFSNESRSSLAGVLVQRAKHGAGFANSGTAGYFAGGSRTTSADSNRVDKVAFSNDTVSNFTMGARYQANTAGFANSGTAGYVALGSDDNGNLTSNVTKILFSNDAVSTITTASLGTRTRHAGFAKSGTAGYIAGGGSTWSGGSPISSIAKFAFSTETTSSVTATLSSARTETASFANSGVL